MQRSSPSFPLQHLSDAITNAMIWTAIQSKFCHKLIPQGAQTLDCIHHLRIRKNWNNIEMPMNTYIYIYMYTYIYIYLYKFKMYIYIFIQMDTNVYEYILYMHKYINLGRLQEQVFCKCKIFQSSKWHQPHSQQQQARTQQRIHIINPNKLCVSFVF